MKEFLYVEKIGNIEDKIKISRNNKCYLVINAELKIDYSTGSTLSKLFIPFPECAKEAWFEVIVSNRG